ncbi:MAG: GH1 family beta-glucosidase [Thermomicrobiales bacterium]
MARPFPPGFLWGAATAAYQIEGAVREGGRGESIWDRFSHTPGKVVNGDTGDIACDAYHRWGADLKVMRDLGLQAYRFSIGWPRIMPTGHGRPNIDGLDFYDELVDGLLAAGIEPWVTLYHWDMPQALEDNGGWPNRSTADFFAEYADAVTRRLGDRVKHWITINEPWCVAFLGYLFGIHAPGRRDLNQAIAAAHTALLAHGYAMEVIRSNAKGARAGITLNLSHVYPTGDFEQDERAAVLADGFLNRWFLDPVFGRGYPEDVVEVLGDAAPEVRSGDLDIIARPTDFLGINTYQPAYVRHDPHGMLGTIGMARVAGERTAMDWLVKPEGLFDLLKRVHDDYTPAHIVITENGSAWDDPAPTAGRVADPRRTDYLHGHLLAARDAIEASVPLDGYFAWSLLDNFEWAEGYTKRFGITYVDFATQERTIKDSGRFYAETIGANGENL